MMAGVLAQLVIVCSAVCVVASPDPNMPFQSFPGCARGIPVCSTTVLADAKLCFHEILIWRRILARSSVTSCLQNVSASTDYRENALAHTLCQAKKTRFSRFIGRDFGLVDRLPPCVAWSPIADWDRAGEAALCSAYPASIGLARS